MQLFRFDANVGRAVTQFNSNFVLAPIVCADHPAHIGCMYIGAGGVVGYHQATVPQLFLVVEGSGWVTSANRVHHPIAATQAAFWQQGEWHESGSDDGMMVIVIEAEALDPAQWMAVLE